MTNCMYSADKPKSARHSYFTCNIVIIAYCFTSHIFMALLCIFIDLYLFFMTLAVIWLHLDLCVDVSALKLARTYHFVISIILFIHQCNEFLYYQPQKTTPRKKNVPTTYYHGMQYYAYYTGWSRTVWYIIICDYLCNH